MTEQPLIVPVALPLQYRCTKGHLTPYICLVEALDSLGVSEVERVE
jgi:hypothetical protein